MLSFVGFMMFLVLMFYYVNSLFYVFVLVSCFLMLMVMMVYYGWLSSLFGVLVALIYIGAMLVLIGYVCAISPNFRAEGVLGYKFLAVMLGSLLVFFGSNIGVGLSVSMVDFLYSFFGVGVFSFVVFILLLTLLLVSSQYFFPKGPFRST